MKGDFALDTNVAIYVFAEDPKATTATGLLEAGPRLSVQMLNEFANASLRKQRAPWSEIDESLGIIVKLAASLRAVDLAVHNRARIVAQRYKLGFYDSLMLGAALLDGCATFYSEDMQHGLVVDGSLTIVNPFLTASVP